MTSVDSPILIDIKECPTCTFRNPEEHQVCEVCFSRMDGDGPPPAKKPCLEDQKKQPASLDHALALQLQEEKKKEYDDSRGIPSNDLQALARVALNWSDGEDAKPAAWTTTSDTSRLNDLFTSLGYDADEDNGKPAASPVARCRKRPVASIDRGVATMNAFPNDEALALQFQEQFDAEVAIDVGISTKIFDDDDAKPFAMGASLGGDGDAKPAARARNDTFFRPIQERAGEEDNAVLFGETIDISGSEDGPQTTRDEQSDSGDGKPAARSTRAAAAQQKHEQDDAYAILFGVDLSADAGMSNDERVARQYQDRFDAEIAASESKPAADTSIDELLARQIQYDEKDVLEEEKKHEESSMLASTQGRSWKVVAQVLELQERFKSTRQDVDITPLAVDDIVYIAERFIDKEKEFEQAGKDTHIRVGFHYTKQMHLHKIRQDGLMNSNERVSRGGHAGAAVFGQGIYTGNNPFAFTSYGDTGLFVAILKGKTKRVREGGLDSDATLDCGIGNKVMSSAANEQVKESLYSDEIVLKTASQVLPLFSFPNRWQGAGSAEAAQLWDFADELQKVLDAFFNKGEVTTISRIDQIETQRDLSRSHRARIGVRPGPIPGGVVLQPSAQAGLPRQGPGLVGNLHHLGQQTMPNPIAFPPSHQSCAHNFVANPIAGRQSNARNSVQMQHQQILHFQNHSIQMPMSKLRAPTVLAPANSSMQMHPPMQQHLGLGMQGAHPVNATAQSSLALRRRAARSAGYVPNVALDGQVSYAAPAKLLANETALGNAFYSSDPAECPICMEVLSSAGMCIQLPKCGHAYHKHCILLALEKSPRCPTCRADILEPQGKSPSGNMTVRHSSCPCSGFESFGTFTITYVLQGGRQMAYHDNPGQRYNSVSRVAYVPASPEGTDLVKRLKYAFAHGLSFTVGTSMTTGVSNCITWSSIHHKTSRHHGAHGYPDANYISNCNQELDALGVPPAGDS